MILSKGGKILVANRGPGVRVARFIDPDPRDQLYDHADIEQTRLFQDLQGSALTDFAEGEMLILNLSMLEHFPTVLYSCLLRIREIVMGHRGVVVLCGVRPETKEILDLFKAERLFVVTKTEAQALKLVGAMGRSRSAAETGEEPVAFEVSKRRLPSQ
jgi:anti-anti-sigma regulatory factor